MREKARIKRILKLIEDYWNKYSDQRFGQLIINMGIADDSNRVWRNEDKDLEKYLILNFKEKKNDI